jgi:uncharacterized membrane protein
MVTPESEQQVEQDVARMRKDPANRASSVVGGLMLGAAGLRRGGVRGAVMALLGGTLFSRGFKKTGPPEIPDPYAGVEHFAEQEGEIAKSQPLVTSSPPPPDTVDLRRPRAR